MNWGLLALRSWKGEGESAMCLETYALTPTHTQTTTTKGTGGDIIILEEAAYVDPQFFYETVAPLLCVGTTTLIGISTLTSEINFYSECAF